MASNQAVLNLINENSQKVDTMSRSISFEEAKARYPNRYTMEHLPQWARKPHYSEETKEFIGYYKPQYRTDLEWYENTTFPGEKDLPKRSMFCETSNQSWPLGKGFSKTPCMRGQQ